MKPVRLRLSRRAGFNLQALSVATNGLPAVNVARPGMWGNPFVIAPTTKPGQVFSGAAYGCIAVPTIEDAVECFREMMKAGGEKADYLRSMLPDLRGKNLACWCKESPCHADVLLELANAPTPPTVISGDEAK